MCLHQFILHILNPTISLPHLPLSPTRGDSSAQTPNTSLSLSTFPATNPTPFVFLVSSSSPTSSFRRLLLLLHHVPPHLLFFFAFFFRPFLFNFSLIPIWFFFFGRFFNEILLWSYYSTIFIPTKLEMGFQVFDLMPHSDSLFLFISFYTYLLLFWILLFSKLIKILTH